MHPAGRSRRGPVLLAGALALVLVPACSAPGPADAGRPTTPAASLDGTAIAPAPTAITPPPTPAPGATTGGAGRPPPEQRITLAFAGDVHFTGAPAALLRAPGTALVSLRPLLGTADLAMLNLEAAITERGTPAPKKYHFRAPASALEAVASGGVDIVSMANNHAVDYGATGLRDTLAARRPGRIPVVGIGADAAQAYAPVILRARGVRVAFLAATQVPDWTRATWPAREGAPGVAVSTDPRRLAVAVRSARRVADVVVVYLHWGTDYTECPDAAQRRTARALAAAGADVLVGGHAHRVQGAGWLGRTYVAYGLGNFVWYRNQPEANGTSGVLTLTLEGRRVVGRRWVPLRIGGNGLPARPATSTSTRMLRNWHAVRACAGLRDRPTPG